MSEFETFLYAVEATWGVFQTDLDFMGMVVRPLDFILATGIVTLFVDVFRMVVMRGRDDG